MTEERADDHVPQNTPRPLQCPVAAFPPASAPPEPSRSDILAAVIKAMRLSPKRERFAKALRLENYALVLERFAEEGDEEHPALCQAAAELRELAAALKE